MTDHENLATTILQNRLDPTRTCIQVCHISAGSWGSGNYAAYFKKHRDLIGTNDVLVVEVNSHDLWEDNPRETSGRNVGKDIALPNHKPWCALWDGFYRYFIPRLRRMAGKAQINTKVDVPLWQTDVHGERAKYNLDMLDELFSLPWVHKAMLIWRSQQESKDNLETPGEKAFRDYASERMIPVIDVCADADKDYRDAIHPSESGQLKIQSAISEWWLHLR